MPPPPTRARRPTKVVEIFERINVNEPQPAQRVKQLTADVRRALRRCRRFRGSCLGGCARFGFSCGLNGSLDIKWVPTGLLELSSICTTATAYRLYAK
jgi:hypothetical protein